MRTYDRTEAIVGVTQPPPQISQISNNTGMGTPSSHNKTYLIQILLALPSIPSVDTHQRRAGAPVPILRTARAPMEAIGERNCNEQQGFL
jgi:hypothetical protein